MKGLPKTDQRIPRKPLLWLAAGLLFTVPPMFSALAIWVPIFFLVTLGAKFWMEPRGYRIRSITLKMISAAAGGAGVLATYGSLSGMEPGVSLIAVLMALKILEAHTARELVVMIMVSWVLCLCGFVLSQDLTTALWLMTAFTLLLVSLVQFHQGPGTARLTPVRVAAKILLSALLPTALLFIAFPRFTTGFRLQLSKSGGAGTGFSGTLSPSSVTSLANSSAIAFHAQFPDGSLPPTAKLYWRGLVLRDCQGLEWRSSEAPAAVPRSAWRQPDKTAIRQLITIEPHGGHWIFALDTPAAPPPGVLLAPGNYLWSPQAVRTARQYEVTSVATSDNKELRTRERALMLDVPGWISPAARQLAASWQAGAGRNPRVVVYNALAFFRSSGFRYSLSPGDYRPNDLDEFLFQRRIGFCEHYAAAFATLMRIAGIPARTVVGYLGGEYNDLGKFVTVRQSDAHAWCELWLPDTGWERVDPTGVVAPDRVTLGFNGFMQARAAASELGPLSASARILNGLARNAMLNRIRIAWQSLNYEWETRVVSFDADAQESMFAAMMLQTGGIFSLIKWTGAAGLTVIALYLGWRLLRRRFRAKTVSSLYQRFCQKTAELGAAREPWEGPADFSRRAAQTIPQGAELIRLISEDYIALRYAPAADAGVLASFAQRVRTFVNVLSKRANRSQSGI